MGANFEIDVLLGTYNGERYLRDLLDSLLAQTNTAWRLLARDDGSTDATPEILRRFESAHPGKIQLLQIPAGNLGVTRNFATLVEHSDADYLMFCDQDDIWLPEKIQSAYEAITTMEGEYGRDVPLLVHSDLTVVDDDLRPIHSSYWRYQWLDPTTNMSLNRLLIQNVVTGCAAIMNRRLRDLAKPVPAEAAMHDWWFALVAAAFGAVRSLDRPTILYRRHENNIVTAERLTSHSLFWSLVTSPIKFNRKYRDKVQSLQKRSRGQANAFLERFEAWFAPKQREIVRCYATLSSQNIIRRRYNVCKFGFWTGSQLRNVAILMYS